jgi:hypothetical protein
MKRPATFSFLFGNRGSSRESGALEDPLDDSAMADPLIGALHANELLRDSIPVLSEASVIPGAIEGFAGAPLLSDEPAFETGPEMSERQIDDRPAVENRSPSSRSRRIVHMHIPKTAGTALRTAFGHAKEPSFRVFPHYDERQFSNANLNEWDVFSGHFGFKTASQLSGDIITVLRHPVDRFISVYYFWRELLEKNIEVNRKTKLTKTYSLDDFACLHDELSLIEEFFNRMTWQVAYGSSIEHRKELRDKGVTDDQVLATAVKNLEAFAVVGMQDRLQLFSRALTKRFGVGLDIKKINVTEARPGIDDISTATRRRICDWVYLDLELYEAAAHHLAKTSHDHA